MRLTWPGMGAFRAGACLVALVIGGCRRPSSGTSESREANLAANRANVCLPAEMRACEGIVVFCGSYECVTPDRGDRPFSAGCFSAPRLIHCVDGGTACAGAGHGNGCEEAVPVAGPGPR